jgi:hypothetical protein
LNISEDDADVRTNLQNLDGLVGICGLKYAKSSVFDHLDRTDADQKFVFYDKDNGPPWDCITHATRSAKIRQAGLDPIVPPFAKYPSGIGPVRARREGDTLRQEPFLRWLLVLLPNPQSKELS